MDISAKSTLDRLVLPAAWQFNRGPRIFMFHSIGSAPVELKEGEPTPQHSQELFATFCEWLVSHATVLTASELAERRRSGGRSSERLVAITLDDGYEDNFTIALPVLRALDIPASVYITTGIIRDDDSAEGCGLTRGQIREMHHSGIEIGAHTVTHPRLTQLDASSAEREIIDSKEALEEVTGARCEGFCYPYGWFDDSVKGLVSKAGFSYAVSTKDVMFPGYDPWALGRTVIPAGGPVSPTEFAIRLCGAHSWRQTLYRAKRPQTMSVG